MWYLIVSIPDLCTLTYFSYIFLVSKDRLNTHFLLQFGPEFPCFSKIHAGAPVAHYLMECIDLQWHVGGMVVRSLLQLQEIWPCYIWHVSRITFALLEAEFG